MAERTDDGTQPDWLRSPQPTTYNATDAAATLEAAAGDVEAASSSLPFLQKIQYLAGIASLILSPISIVLVAMWASSLGGVSWAEGDAKRVFNWHPILMVRVSSFLNVTALIVMHTTNQFSPFSMQI
jgi:hypothetical protein